MERFWPLLELSESLEDNGLVWHPELGDEIADRSKKDMVSILVDNQGLTPSELRETYLWLPTVEQMLYQIEARQAVLLHAGLELSNTSFCYKAVLQVRGSAVEGEAQSLRQAVGKALCDLLMISSENSMH